MTVMYCTLDIASLIVEFDAFCASATSWHLPRRPEGSVHVCLESCASEVVLWHVSIVYGVASEDAGGISAVHGLAEHILCRKLDNNTSATIVTGM